MTKEKDVPPATSRWWPYQEALVYKLATPGGKVPELPAMPGLSWVSLNEGTIPRVFADSPALTRRFQRFARQGAMGVAIMHGRTWLTYAWMATPEGRQPYHLPAAMQGKYWVYYCHTRPSFRGHGLMGYAVRLLVAEMVAREQLMPSTLYCDVMPDNMASRRAFLRLGFKPAGRVATWRLPKSSLVMGGWDPLAAHDAVTLAYPKSS